MNSYCVYKHTTPSGKVYIGITCQNVEKRWKNGKGYELCTAFWRAIQKYGWDNIKHEIVRFELTKEEACAEERRLIAFYDSSNPLHGYNLTSGGEHYEHSDDVRARLRDSHLRYYQEHPEARRQISDAQKGRTNTPESNEKRRNTMIQYFIDHPEQRHERGKSFRGKKRSAEFSKNLGERKSKPVICLTTGKRYDSVKSASLAESVSRTGITNMLSGRAKTCGGKVFAYANGTGRVDTDRRSLHDV